MILLNPRRALSLFVLAQTLSFSLRSEAAQNDRAGQPYETAASLLRAAQSASDARANCLAARWAKENSKLESLNLLKSHGHASWREVAEQEVVVAAFAAERRAAQQFDMFLEAVEKRLQDIGDDGFSAAATGAFDGSTQLLGDCLSDDRAVALRDCTLRLAASNAAARGELAAAEISLVRHQLRRDAYQKLHAQGYVTEGELNRIRDAVAAAESLVARLKEERSKRVQAYGMLRAVAAPDDANAAGDLQWIAVSDPPVHANEPVAAEYSPDELPVPTLADPAALEQILEVRRSQYDTMAGIDASAAKLAMLEQLSQRLEQAEHESESRRRELQFVRLDIDYVRALSLAAEERLKSLRLGEAYIVRQVLFEVAAFDAPMPARPAVARRGVLANYMEALHSIEWAGHRSVPQSETDLGPLFGSAAELRPPPSSLPPGDSSFLYYSACLQPRLWCYDRRGCVASDVPDRTNFYLVPYGSRYRPIDSYSDYYEFGRLRPEIYFCGPCAPSSGVPPWYLPGSPQNYPYPPATRFFHVRSQFGVSRSLEARTARSGAITR